MSPAGMRSGNVGTETSSLPGRATRHLFVVHVDCAGNGTYRATIRTKRSYVAPQYGRVAQKFVFSAAVKA